MQQIEIRKATISDSEEISRLISRNCQRLLMDDFEGDGLNFFLRSVETRAIREYMEQGFEYLVAELNGQVVGVIAVKDYSHMFHLFVDLDFHNRGIARCLWAKMKELSIAKGNSGRFTLNSTTYALPIYQSWGFQVSGEKAQRFGINYTPMVLEL